MKSLNGRELADYIKERQAKQVRSLRQSQGIVPTLAIIQAIDDPVIDTYVRLKQAYGEDILVDVLHHKVAQSEIEPLVQRLNEESGVHGIILQLPLEDVSQTDRLVNLVTAEKDVDGLATDTKFDPATPIAINWLLNGYGLQLNQKKIVIVGEGRLVGAPLYRMWKQSGYDVQIATRENSSDLLPEADIIISAVGSPGIITSNLVQIGAVIVDAGTADENGAIVGDVADDVRERNDVSITPKKGGVGPLTVSALFDNVLRAASSDSN